MGRKKKTEDFRQVGFRLPTARYELLLTVAEARGIDLSAVLNQLIAEAEPDLRTWLDARSGRLHHVLRMLSYHAPFRALPRDDAMVVLRVREHLAILPEAKRGGEILPLVRRFLSEAKKPTL